MDNLKLFQWKIPSFKSVIVCAQGSGECSCFYTDTSSFFKALHFSSFWRIIHKGSFVCVCVCVCEGFPVGNILSSCAMQLCVCVFGVCIGVFMWKSYMKFHISCRCRNAALIEVFRPYKYALWDHTVHNSITLTMSYAPCSFIRI